MDDPTEIPSPTLRKRRKTEELQIKTLTEREGQIVPQEFATPIKPRLDEILHSPVSEDLTSTEEEDIKYSNESINVDENITIWAYLRACLGDETGVKEPPFNEMNLFISVPYMLERVIITCLGGE